MSTPVPTGTWVEIHRVLLPPGSRAPQVPEDTRAVPLEMRVKGFLLTPAELQGPASIRTRSGRLLDGTLTAVNPAYRHGFGPPVPELSAIGDEVRRLLADQGNER